MFRRGRGNKIQVYRTILKIPLISEALQTQREQLPGTESKHSFGLEVKGLHVCQQPCPRLQQEKQSMTKKRKFLQDGSWLIVFLKSRKVRHNSSSKCKISLSFIIYTMLLIHGLKPWQKLGPWCSSIVPDNLERRQEEPWSLGDESLVWTTQQELQRKKKKFNNYIQIKIYSLKNSLHKYRRQGRRTPRSRFQRLPKLLLQVSVPYVEGRM